MNIQMDLFEEEALVLFEWLSGFDVDTVLASERLAIASVVAALERQLVAPFRSDYAEVVAAARARLENG